MYFSEVTFKNDGVTVSFKACKLCQITSNLSRTSKINSAYKILWILTLKYVF